MYERGLRALREGAPDAKEEAVMLLEAWREFERGVEGGDAAARRAALAAVEAKMPKRVKRKRAVRMEDGTQVSVEEWQEGRRCGDESWGPFCRCCKCLRGCVS